MNNKIVRLILIFILILIMLFSSFTSMTTSSLFTSTTSNNQLIEIGRNNGLMNSSWPMKCHDTHHTGRSPYNTSDNPGDTKWRFKTENRGGTIESSIVIDNEGTIYFGTMGSDHQLYALYQNGTKKWSYSVGLLIWSTPAIADDGTIYVPSFDDYLYAINPNGSLKWRFCAYDSISSSPAISEDGVIYFGTMGEGHKIYAVNPDGTEKWNYPTGYYITSDPAIGDDGTIYIGSSDCHLYALYPNGTLRWTYETGDWIKGHPSIADDGTIYVPSYDDYLYAIYPDGTFKWKTDTGFGASSSAAIGYDGTVYIGTDELRALYPNNGTVKWSLNVGGDIVQASPAISADGTIYVCNHNGKSIVSVNPDGTEKWRKQISNLRADSSPVIAEDGTIYVGSSWVDEGGWGFGYLYAIGRGELIANAHGPYNGIVNEPVQFTGSASGGYPPYTYHWDFGDDETSDDQNPAHEYTSARNFTVTLTVTDDNDTVAVDTTWALIRESNEHPSKPSIDGETEGNYGESYDYTFITIDLDGDDVWYYIEWGDGDVEEWIGPYSSGEEVVRSHTWDEEGTYTIRAKAKDIFDAESDWGTLDITMPINQQSSDSLLIRFLERFPNAFPILRHVLGL